MSFLAIQARALLQTIFRLAEKKLLKLLFVQCGSLLDMSITSLDRKLTFRNG